MAIFVCPNCKGVDIQRVKKGKYTSFGCLLIIIGIPLLLLNGLGVIFIAAGLFLGCITKSAFRCLNCKIEF